MSTRRHTPRGSGLIDALIALAILAFGLLAMTRFQVRLVAQATDAQSRQTATQFASELLSTVLVDAANAACYTLPQAGSCSNSPAALRTSQWATRAVGALPAPASATAALNAASGRMTVTLTWRAKDEGETRTFQSVTDVRL